MSELATEVPEDVRLQAVPPGEVIEGASDEVKIRRAMAEVRAERGERPRDEIKVWDGVPVPDTGEHQSPHSAAGRATDYMRDMREQDVAEGLKTRDGLVRALYEHPDAVAGATLYGKSEEELAAELVKGPKPEIVNPIVEGNVLKPLADHTKPMNLTDADLFENPRDAARAMGEWRDVINRGRTAVIADLDQQIAEQQAAIEAAQASPPPVAPAPQAPGQPPVTPVQQQGPDPVAIERAHLAQERQAVEQFRRLSVAEAEHAVEINKGIQFYRAQGFPALNDAAAINELASTDYQKFELFRNTVEALQRHQTQLAGLQAAKVPYEQRQQSQMQAVRAQYGSAEDNKYANAVGKHEALSKIPTGELRQAAKKILTDFGLNDQQIAAHWQNGAPVDIRSAPVQMIIAKAAAYDLGLARAKDIASKRVHAHQPLVPGVHRPANAGALEDVRALEQQLHTASGNAALRLATRLTQARRRAGV